MDKFKSINRMRRFIMVSMILLLVPVVIFVVKINYLTVIQGQVFLFILGGMVVLVALFDQVGAAIWRTLRLP